MMYDKATVWLQLEVTLRTLTQAGERLTKELNLSVIEYHILRSLFLKDGQKASELARSVGRAATSFTPNLDKLEAKGYIQREADPGDRRYAIIRLTLQAHACKGALEDLAERMNAQIPPVASEDYAAFQRVLATIQAVQS